MSTDFEIADLDANPITDAELLARLTSAVDELRRRGVAVRGHAPPAGAGDEWLAQRRRAAVCLEYAADLITDYILDGRDAQP